MSQCARGWRAFQVSWWTVLSKVPDNQASKNSENSLKKDHELISSYVINSAFASDEALIENSCAILVGAPKRNTSHMIVLTQKLNTQWSINVETTWLKVFVTAFWLGRWKFGTKVEIRIFKYPQKFHVSISCDHFCKKRYLPSETGNKFHLKIF